MFTHGNVCLQVSGVKLKHEEPVEVSTPASHPIVNLCADAAHSNKLSITFSSHGVCL